MSRPGTERFCKAVSNDSGLKSEAERVGGIASLAKLARSKGYEVTEDDLNGLASGGGEIAFDLLKLVRKSD